MQFYIYSAEAAAISCDATVSCCGQGFIVSTSRDDTLVLSIIVATVIVMM